MAASRSWSSVHFRTQDAPPKEFDFLDGAEGGLSDQLAALQMDDRTAERIRVYDHHEKQCRARCFRIERWDEIAGRREWKEKQ